MLEVFLISKEAIDSLPQQAGESKLRILSTEVGQILRGQLTDTQPLAEFTHQFQTALGSNVKTLEASVIGTSG